MKPVDLILYAIVIALVVFCGFKSLKHFRGEGDCCGGSSVSAEKKKLDGKVIGKKTMKIEGMHCKNCSARVQSQLNKIDGVSAEVSLKKNTAVIQFDREVEDTLLIDAVEKIGYKVISLA